MKAPNTGTAQGASSKACSLNAVNANSLVENVSRETTSARNNQTNSNTVQGASRTAWGLFKLGELAITPAARGTLDKHSVYAFELFGRHVHGDFGDLCDEDKAANTAAIEAGDRILSSYRLGSDKVWVITEADRSVTTILLPSDY